LPTTQSAAHWLGSYCPAVGGKHMPLIDISDSQQLMSSTSRASGHAVAVTCVDCSSAS